MDLNGILLISDLDGTLIDNSFTVSRRNRDAIERFKRAGGNFSVATGRSLDSGAQYIAAVEPNCPGIILNGTVLYDFENRKMLWNHPLNIAAAEECIKRIHSRFPQTGIEVFTTEGVGVVNWNGRIKKHLDREGIRDYISDLFHNQLLCKALLADDADVIQDIIAYTNTFDHPDIRFVTSNPNYLEMLPANADKGSALKELALLCGFSVDQVYAIGDYYNDVELLQAAGFAAMPENAPDDLKHYADRVVCSSDEGAVADLIEYLEQK